jgi:hypothetical protein
MEPGIMQSQRKAPKPAEHQQGYQREGYQPEQQIEGYQREGYQGEEHQIEGDQREGYPNPVIQMEDKKHAEEAIAIRNEKLWAKAIKKYKKDKERTGQPSLLDWHSKSQAESLSIQHEMLVTKYRFYHYKRTGNEPPPLQASEKKFPNRK